MPPLSIGLLLLAPLLPQVEVVTGDGKKLDAYLERCETFGFSGVALVERKGSVLLAKGYGLADPIERTPNTPDTLYDIASTSKQVTAAAILLLESRDELKTSDRLSDHLPDVPEDLRDITLAHLIHHTSGFPRMGVSGFGDDRAAAVAKYLSAKRGARAGERFEYFNGGYALLAAVVEVVSEQSFEDFVETELFRPAGLERTSFLATIPKDAGPLAVSHATGDPITGHSSGWEYRGMGGVVTSARELARWCGALFGGRVLPRKQLDWMLEPDLETYAGGWYVFETDGKRKVVQHGGTVDAFDTYIRWFPKEQTLILVLTNRPGWNWQTAWGLTALVLPGEDAKAAPPPEIAKWKERALEQWLGSWRSADGQRLELERSGDGVRVSGIGGDVLAALSPPSYTRPGSSKPRSLSAAPRAELEARALAIVDGLREGDIKALSTDMASHIGEAWPVRVRDQYWPAHIERWGALQDRSVLGTFDDPDSGQTRVWLRLKHARAERSLEIAFVAGKLARFDLKSPDWPIEAGAAPVGDQLVGFDFAKAPPFTLELKGKDSSSRLTLEGRDGTKLELERAQ